MPVLINDIVVEVNEDVTTDTEAGPDHQQSPVAPAEFEIARTLALIEQRRDRLKID